MDAERLPGWQCDVCVVNTDGRRTPMSCSTGQGGLAGLCLDPRFLGFVLPSMADFNLYLLGVIKHNLSIKAFGEFCESF